MRTLIPTTLAALLCTTAYAAAVDLFTLMTKAEIDALPPEQVRIVRQHCLSEWPENFYLRAVCEDMQYKALMALIDRSGRQE